MVLGIGKADTGAGGISISRADGEIETPAAGPGVKTNLLRRVAKRFHARSDMLPGQCIACFSCLLGFQLDACFDDLLA